MKRCLMILILIIGTLFLFSCEYNSDDIYDIQDKLVEIEEKQNEDIQDIYNYIEELEDKIEKQDDYIISLEAELEEHLYYH